MIMIRPDPLAAHFRRDTYLGFDFGDKKIGVAVGNATTAIASPLETLRAVKQRPDWHGLTRLIALWQPVALVVGVSRQHDGGDNPVTPKILKFCHQLHGRFGLPVHTIDETLSTFEAKQMLFDELGVTATRLWAVQDQLAAQRILQSWFHANRRMLCSEETA